MRCVNHSEREAVNVCSHCGRDLCGDCLVEVNGHLLCKQCVAALAGRPKHTHPHHGGYGGHGGGEGYHCKKRRSFSKFLLFMVSALPGLGYMYMGLIKRGLFVMSLFFLNIFLLVEFENAFFAFLIPIIFFAAFFDGFRILRLINAGETVTDSVEDLKAFFCNHKKVILGTLSGVILVSFLSGIMRWGFNFFRYSNAFGVIPALLLIGVGIYFIFMRNGRAGRRHEDSHKHEEYRNNDEQ